MYALTQRLPPASPQTIREMHYALSIKAAAAALWYLGPSEIEGQGVFAGKDFSAGDDIGVAAVADGVDEFEHKVWNLTLLARYCNHQTDANVVLTRDGELCRLTASRNIAADEELVADYAQVTKAFGRRTRVLWDGRPIPVADLSKFTERKNDKTDS